MDRTRELVYFQVLTFTLGRSREVISESTVVNGATPDG
jgi:hypothetical protein